MKSILNKFLDTESDHILQFEYNQSAVYLYNEFAGFISETPTLV